MTVLSVRRWAISAVGVRFVACDKSRTAASPPCSRYCNTSCRFGSSVRAASSRSRASQLHGAHCGACPPAKATSGRRSAKEQAEEDTQQQPPPSKRKWSLAKPGVKYRGVAPLQVRAAWVRLSLHVGGKDAAHQTADEAAE